MRCMTSKENNYSFSHAPCLSPFKLSLSDHLLTWNGIIHCPHHRHTRWENNAYSLNKRKRPLTGKRVAKADVRIRHDTGESTTD